VDNHEQKREHSKDTRDNHSRQEDAWHGASREAWANTQDLAAKRSTGQSNELQPGHVDGTGITFQGGNHTSKSDQLRENAKKSLKEMSAIDDLQEAAGITGRDVKGHVVRGGGGGLSEFQLKIFQEEIQKRDPQNGGQRAVSAREKFDSIVENMSESQKEQYRKNQEIAASPRDFEDKTKADLPADVQWDRLWQDYDHLSKSASKDLVTAYKLDKGKPERRSEDLRALGELAGKNGIINYPRRVWELDSELAKIGMHANPREQKVEANKRQKN
jgi:hypothetical protein